MDDDDFEYADEAFDRSRLDKDKLRSISSMQRHTTVTVQNQPHDEEVALSESESLASPNGPPSIKGFMEPSAASQLEASADDYSLGSRSELSPSPQQQQQFNDSRSLQESPSGAGPESPAASEGALGAFADVPGGYNPADFAHLNVTEDVRDVFKYISRYRPAVAELAAPLQAFIPEFIPAYGGPDEFIKVPRPDGRPDWLGLKVLDEPAAVQSDPTMLNLQLRQLSKEAPGVRLQVVGRIEHCDKERSAGLAGWISSIAELHKSKPTAAVAYSRPMPDLEALMQEWPPELEAALQTCKLPTAELDLDLESYARLVCALLDVPVYGNILEPLHLLFSLYLEFASNPFFTQHLQAQADASSGGGCGVAAAEVVAM